jgi:hypothetical protein
VEYHRCLVDAEILRVSGTVEFKAHLHELFSRDLTTRKLLQHHGPILSVQLLSLFDALYVIALKLQPPVVLELRQRCKVVSRSCNNTKRSGIPYTWSDDTPIEAADKASPWQ